MAGVARLNRVLYRWKLYALEQEIYSSLDIWIGQKKRLPRCSDFWHLLEPTHCARYEGYLSQQLGWMQMQELQPESAASGCGRLHLD